MRSIKLISIILLSAISIVAYSAQKVWDSNNITNFSLGKPTNVSIDSTGNLSLSPYAVDFFSIPDTHAVDAVKSGSDYYIAGGSGKLFILNPGIKLLTTFEKERILCLYPYEDGVLVGVAPTGKIYLVNSKGEKKLFLKTGSMYVWGIEKIDEFFYIITGVSPKLIRYSDLTGREILFQRNTKHFTELTGAFDSAILFGESNTGLVFRYWIDKEKTEVVYDTAGQEITGLAQTESGDILICSIYLTGTKLPALMTIPIQKKTGNEEKDPDLAEVIGEEIALEQGIPEYASKGSGAMMYMVSSDGILKETWNLQKSFILDCYYNAQTGWIAGSDYQGMIFSIPPGKTPGLFKKMDENVVVKFKEIDGKIVILTGFPAKAYLLSQETGNSGHLISDVLDTGTAGFWGRIFWEGDVPSGTEVEFYTRTGNSEKPDGFWNPWSGPYMVSGSRIDSPPARFIQWKAVLKSRLNNVSPSISRIKVTFTEKNLKPVITELKVTPPQFSTLLSSESVGMKDGNIFSGQTNTGNQEYPLKNTSPLIKIEWTALDENFDAVKSSLYITKIGTGQWKKLADNLRESNYQFESNYFDDGSYKIKLVVTDLPSHHPDKALEDVKISEMFVIDNTPPSVKITKQENGIIYLVCNDNATHITRLDYQVDFKKWNSTVPIDEIYDSVTEEFKLNLSQLRSGQHMLLIRVIDKQGNVEYLRKYLDIK